MTSSDPSPSTALERVVLGLVGRTLHDGKRAADMKMFGFGDERRISGRRGPRTIHQWMLHISCPWTLSHHDEVVAVSTDWLARPAGQSIEQTDAPVLGLIASRPRVRAVALSADLDLLRIGCDDGVVLELHPDDDDSEQWRLLHFGPPDSATGVSTSTAHYVVDRVAGNLMWTIE